MFTVVWAFQLLFSYCPISPTDHLLSPSCRALIACSKANWAESANWQFIRRRAPPKKEIGLQSQNLRSRGYPWVPPVRTWIQAAKNLDPHNQPRTPTQLDVLKAIKVNLLSLNLGKGMLHYLLADKTHWLKNKTWIVNMISWPQVIDHSTIRDCSHIMATKFMGLWNPLSPIFKEIANCTKGDLCNYVRNRFCAVRPQIFKCQQWDALQPKWYFWHIC